MIEKNLIRVEFTLTKWNSLLQLSSRNYFCHMKCHMKFFVKIYFRQKLEQQYIKTISVVVTSHTLTRGCIYI